jgi:23S rRNA pseudouridine1911/1915/1917 synthase
MKEIKYIAKIEDMDKRLDVFLVERMGEGRSEVQRMIESGKVLLNGRIPKKSGEKLKENYVVDIVSVIPDTSPSVDITDDVLDSIKNKDENTDIYEDVEVVADEDDYLVISKPAGLLTHPTQAGEPVSLSGWIFKNYPQLEGVGEYANRPGIVHRLDRDASGLMVIAKNQKMFDHLKAQFKNRDIDKEYIVLVYGSVAKNNGIIDFDIDRGKDGRMVARPKIDKMKVSNVGKEQSGKQAKSEYWLERDYKRFSLLRVKIYTGRTHQIRVHMYAINHPVVGDTIYMDRKLIKKSDRSLDRLFLHSVKLGFRDLRGEERVYEMDLSEDLEDHLRSIK